MNAAIMKTLPITTMFDTDAQRWDAVTHRDARADGAFFYSVRTTGVYCRPSCASRLARRENVAFHATCADAERAGFRPCKRCRPNEAPLAERQAEAVAKACRLIEAADAPPSLDELAAAVGMSRYHFHRVFKATTGVTPKAYADARRADRVRSELPKRATVTDAIYEAGFNSNGRFYAQTSKTLGMKPSDYRAGGSGASIRFAVGQCSLGSILVAATTRGVCAITLGDDPDELVRDLQDRFPSATLSGRRRRVRTLGGDRGRFRRSAAARTRSAARRTRHRVSATRLESAVRDPAGFDRELRRHRHASGRAEGGARRRAGVQSECAGGGHSVSSHRSQGRRVVRVSLGRCAQTRTAEARGNGQVNWSEIAARLDADGCAVLPGSAVGDRVRRGARRLRERGVVPQAHRDGTPRLRPR